MDRADGGGLLATNNPVVADVERNAAAVAQRGQLIFLAILIAPSPVALSDIDQAVVSE